MLLRMNFLKSIFIFTQKMPDSFIMYFFFCHVIITLESIIILVNKNNISNAE